MLRRILISLLATALAAAAFVAWSLDSPNSPQPHLEGTFRIAGVQLIEPGIRRSVNTTLEVRDGVLSSVRATRSGESSDLEESPGMYVLPGLMDLHTHLPPDSPLALTEIFGLLYIAHGVTTVRDAGDLDGSAYPAALRVYAEERNVGPRPLTCGPFVGGPGSRWANSVAVERPEQAQEVVQGLIDAGYHCIKIYDGLDRERIRALVDAARSVGLPALGHVPFGMTFEEARLPNTQHLMGVALPETIAAGDHVIHRIMDWSSVDAARMRDVVRISSELGLVHTPTLAPEYALRHYRDLEAARSEASIALLPRFYRDVVWDPELGVRTYRGLSEDDLDLFDETLRKKLQMIRLLHEAGVELRIGTDTQQPFVVPGASVWTEMRLWERAGIPIEDIWAYATWKGAAETGIERLGRFEEGAPADFLVFADDPTRSLDALDSLVAISAGGRLHLYSDLSSSIEEYRAFYERWLVDELSIRVAKAKLASTSSSDEHANGVESR
ncbi:MAG: amidohydrolase family protein [Deltaproteobacteria bacterium]|nr:amidohydrolase family protein [Deltaproteobacteria bacterium]